MANIAARALVRDDSWNAAFADDGPYFRAAFFAHRAEAVLVGEAEATLNDCKLRAGDFFWLCLWLRCLRHKAAEEIASGESGHVVKKRIQRMA